MVTDSTGMRVSSGERMCPRRVPPGRERTAERAAPLFAMEIVQIRAVGEFASQRLEPLVPANETRQSNYAYLFDRVAVNSGRPTRSRSCSEG